MELLAKLGINWQMMLAQLINFLLLMGVLTFFIYKPFLKVLDQRRHKIKQSMDDAKRIEEEKRLMEEWKKEQMRKMDAEASSFIDSAKQQAESLKREMMASAQKEADSVMEKAKQQMEQEKSKMVSELKAEIGTIVIKLAEKVLEREVSDKDDSRIAADIEETLPALLK